MHKKVLLDLNHIEAVIFDLDGTMVDNMPYQIKAWIGFAAKYGQSLTEEIFEKKYSGLRSDAILVDLFQKDLSPEEIDIYRKERAVMYTKIFEDYIQEVEGLTPLLDELQKRNIKLALATTASKGNREFALEKLKVGHYFQIILGGEDVIKGKPDPEIYNLAVSQLNVNPEKCIAFEDSLVGIQAAISANLSVIALLTTHKEEELPEVMGSIHNFTEVQID